MKTTLYLLLIFITFSLKVKAQEITTIPDPGFEQVLIDKGIDSDGEINGQVLTSDIENLTELEIVDYEI